MVGIADPDTTRAQEIIEIKLQGLHSHMYRECRVFSTYLDALNAMPVDIAFIGKSRKMT